MSSSDLFKLIFLIGLIAAEVIRFPHRMRVKQARRQKKATDDRTRPIDSALDLGAFAGMEIIPLIYVFSGWPQSADYARLDLLGWPGAIGFAGCLYVLYRAHIDLGRNWSPRSRSRPPSRWSRRVSTASFAIPSTRQCGCGAQRKLCC